jgi:hypothetical protein
VSRLATMTDAEFAAEMARLDAVIANIRRINRRLARKTRAANAALQKEIAA